jgi:hypothetical protein
MRPEAPIEGQKSKLSRRGGANFLMYEVSKFSCLVSWRQTIEYELSSILFFLKATYLAS